MPDPIKKPITSPHEPVTDPSTEVDWFADMPGGVEALDALFEEPQTTAPSDPHTEVQPQDEPAKEPEDDFIRTGSGTVYKTKEDAIKGVEHKDALIEKLRMAEIARSGIDPLTGQPVRGPQTQAPVSYRQDPVRAYQELSEAVAKNDAKRFTEILDTLNKEALDERLAPFAPLITNLAKQQAIEAVEAELKGFREFHSKPDFANVIKALPELEQAIQVAESDPRFHDKLAGLYKMSYLAAQGMRLPELIRARATTAPQNQPVRSPTNPGTLTPANATATKPGLTTSEGRKAIIEQFEQSGGLDRIRF